MFYRYFLVFFVAIFSLTFVIAADCIYGQVSNDVTQFCNQSGFWENKKVDDVACFNNFECVSDSCLDTGVCGNVFEQVSEGITQQNTLLENFFNTLMGYECTPGTENCTGTIYSICGSAGAWEINRQTNGKCGYVTPVSPGGGGGGGGGGSPGCNPLWKCTVWSGTASNGTLCGTRTCTRTNTYCNLNVGKPIESLSCGAGVPSGSSCGDGECSVDETQYSCAEDCGEPNLQSSLVEDVCGDGACGDSESSFGCPDDCPAKKPTSRWWLIPIMILLLAGIGVGIYFLVKVIKDKMAEKAMLSA